jgi:hypothetical protein
VSKEEGTNMCCIDFTQQYVHHHHIQSIQYPSVKGGGILELDHPRLFTTKLNSIISHGAHNFKPRTTQHWFLPRFGERGIWMNIVQSGKLVVNLLPFGFVIERLFKSSPFGSRDIVEALT